MLQGEHSAILSTFIQLPFVIKIFVLSILELPFTQVLLYMMYLSKVNNYASLKAVFRPMKKALNCRVNHDQLPAMAQESPAFGGNVCQMSNSTATISGAGSRTLPSMQFQRQSSVHLTKHLTPDAVI